MDLVDITITIYEFLDIQKATLLKDFIVNWCAEKIPHELFWGYPACKEELKDEHSKFTIRLPNAVFSHLFLFDLIKNIHSSLPLYDLAPETCFTLDYKFLTSSMSVSPLHIQ